MDSVATQSGKTARRKRSSSKDLTRGNSTILIGARLLNVVARFDGPVSLTNVAQAARMSPSRTYRYLRGLCDSGLLEQSEPSGLDDVPAIRLRESAQAVSRKLGGISETAYT